MHTTTTSLDPRIGLLMREGRPVHYAFVHGYDQPAVEGSREEVEIALGLRTAPAKPKKAKRAYVVTVTIAPPAGLENPNPAVFGSYEFDAYEASASDAITAARRDYREREGRLAIAATYKARRVQ